MKQEETKICYEKRNQMSRLLFDRGFDIGTAAELVAPMRGKSDEEKERMAEDMINKILSGEICPTVDAQKRSADSK